MELIIIAAVSENNVIGKDGKLPWHIPEDMKHFRSLTLGHPVIMGRKTFESLGKPLDKRVNIVITSQKNYTPEGIVIVHTFQEALDRCRNYEKAFVIGGASVFADALPLADRLELTRVHSNIEGDAFFPDFDLSQWKEIAKEEHEGFSFITYTRRK